LRKIFLARTTAYWQYGPVSPSKLSASLKSNAMIARTREFQKEISQRADGDRVRDGGSFLSGDAGWRWSTSARAAASADRADHRLSRPVPFYR